MVSRNAKDFISKLLVVASVRLGALKNGAADICNHAFLKPTDMQRLEKGKLKAPYKPDVSCSSDTSNFEVLEDVEDSPSERVSSIDKACEAKLDEEFRME